MPKPVQLIPCPEHEYLRTREVLGWLNVSQASLHRWMERFDFPRPIKLGGRALRWRKADVQRWIDGRPEVGPVGRGDGAHSAVRAEGR